MSSESHSAKSRPEDLDGYFGKCKDTSESRVLVIVERHLSENFHGRGVFS